MDRGLIAILTGLTAFAVSLLLVRLTIRFALKHQILDTVGPRKVNPNRVPRIAGPAILIAFLAGLAMTWLLGVDRFEIEVNRIWLLVIASIVLVAVMLIDDIKGIPPLPKLAIQIVVSLILVLPYAFDRD